MFDSDSWARIKARAFNGRDLDTFVSGMAHDTRCLRDGELLGEGPEAIRDGIEAEYRTRDPVVRLLNVDGARVFAECSKEGRGVDGVLRFVVEEDHVREFHIEHGPLLLEGTPE